MSDNYQHDKRQHTGILNAAKNVRFLHILLFLLLTARRSTQQAASRHFTTGVTNCICDLEITHSHVA